jgi:hypothetical protein
MKCKLNFVVEQGSFIYLKWYISVLSFFLRNAGMYTCSNNYDLRKFRAMRYLPERNDRARREGVLYSGDQNCHAGYPVEHTGFFFRNVAYSSYDARSEMFETDSTSSTWSARGWKIIC